MLIRTPLPASTSVKAALGELHALIGVENFRRTMPGRAPSEDEQRRLLHFIGFGATDAGNEAPGALATFGVETAGRAVTERSRST